MTAEEIEGPLWKGEAVEITVMMEYISKYLGKRFVYDPDKLGSKKIAILSEGRIPRESVYKIFQSIMQMNDFALIDYGNYIRVESLSKAKTMYSGILSEKEASNVADEDRLITRVFKLEHADVNTLAQVIQRLINTQSEQIVPLVDSNTLVISGFARNLERIAQVIRTSDQPGLRTYTEYIELSHAKADEVTKTLQSLMQGFSMSRKKLGAIGSKMAPPKLISAARRNAVIMTGLKKEIKEVKELLKKLDTPALEVKTQFVKLKYAASEEVAKQLSALTKIYAAGRNNPGPKNHLPPPQVLADKRTNSLILTGTKDELSEFLDFIQKLDVDVPSMETTIKVFPVRNVDAGDLLKVLEKILKPERSAAKSKDGPNGKVANVQGKDSEASSEEIGILEMVVQGSAIVARATDRGLNRVENLLKELDIRRPKVLIEAAIIELTVGKDFDLGVELATVDEASRKGRLFGATSFGISNLLDNDGDGVPETRVPIFGPGDPAFIAGILKERQGRIPLLIKALESRTRVKVLAAPMVVADDNEEARFSASDQFPVATFTTTQSTTDVTAFGSFQEAKIELIIKPNINEKEGYLRLDIRQKVEVFKGNPPADNLPPRKDSRELSAVVTVPNGRTVVLGGLSTNTIDSTVSGIPFLHRIPILGVLFRRKQDSEKQTRLYVFVTPTILKDESFEDFERVSKDRQDELDRLIEEQEEKEESWKFWKKKEKQGRAKKENRMRMSR